MATLCIVFQLPYSTGIGESKPCDIPLHIEQALDIIACDFKTIVIKTVAQLKSLVLIIRVMATKI